MFNAKKATDMAIHLLKKAGGKDNTSYFKILKLMYLAERESILCFAEPMCGDDMYSLPHGPILSKTADFMRGMIQASEWCEMIRPDGQYALALVDPNTRGYRKLSRADKKILDDIWETQKNRTWTEMRDWTHKNCPEWDKSLEDKDCHYRRSPISMDKLLTSVGIVDEKDVEATLRHLDFVDSFAQATKHW